MKKLIFVSALSLFTCSAFIPATSYAQSTMKSDKAPKDGSVKMVGGKMMVAKGGNWVAMTKTMTMSNGSSVMTDGTVMAKDGKKSMLKEGDCMKPDGMMAKKM